VKRFILILALASCRKETAPAQAAAVVQAPEAASADAGFVLTAAMIDAYLRYQKAVDAEGSDAGVYDRAAREDAALKEAGLSDAEVAVIDDMVSTVIARRMVTQLGANPEFMPDMAKMGAALNDEQKKRLQEAMVAFKAQQQAARELTEERKRFGSKNIDVLLTREAELTRAWAQQMHVPPAMMGK
jgi:hypothetical protein